MHTRFKRHQLVRLLRDADPEYVEYAEESENPKQVPIKAGMLGKINIALPNGKYHVEILSPKDKSKIIAYAPFEEESLEEVE